MLVPLIAVEELKEQVKEQKDQLNQVVDAVITLSNPYA